MSTPYQVRLKPCDYVRKNPDTIITVEDDEHGFPFLRVKQCQAGRHWQQDPTKGNDCQWNYPLDLSELDPGDTCPTCGSTLVESEITLFHHKQPDGWSISLSSWKGPGPMPIPESAEDLRLGSLEEALAWITNKVQVDPPRA